MKEIWKDIWGYEGIYQVSNLGRIRSLTRYDAADRLIRGRIMSINYSNITGRASIGLTKLAASETLSVKKVVADHFVSNPYNFQYVRCKDGDEHNCKANNLEWYSAKEMRETIVKHTDYAQRSSKIDQREIAAKIDWKARNKKIDFKKAAKKHDYDAIHQKEMKPVLQFSLDGKLLHKYKSISDAAKQNKCYPTQISECCHHRKYHCTYVGYRWEFANTKQQLEVDKRVVKNRLKKVRKGKGLTAQQVADAIGVSNNTISRYENEKRNPNLKTWLELANYFDVPVTYLQGIDNEED